MGGGEGRGGMGEGRGEKEKVRKRGGRWKHYKKGPNRCLRREFVLILRVGAGGLSRGINFAN